jgi:hypothetical protein
MSSLKTYLAAALLSAIFSSPALAQTHSDTLLRCYDQYATQEERAAWVRWEVSGLLLHPALKDLVAPIPSENRQRISRDVMTAFERLTLVACRKEAIAILQKEGEGALYWSNSMFGVVVTRSYFGDAAVTDGLSESLASLDKAKWTALFKEAGLPASSNGK